MKFIQTLCAFTILATLVVHPHSVFAGGDDGGATVGNGGNLLICLNQQSEYHNMALDLFELNHVFGFSQQYSLQEKHLESDIKKTLIDRLYRLKPDFAEFINITIREFNYDAVEKDLDFEFSNDLDKIDYPQNIEPPTIPESCEYKTVIFQRTFRPFFIKSPYLRQVNSINYFALKVHEAVYNYSILKHRTLDTSYRVRRLTAYLFSKEFFSNEDSRLLRKYISLL